MECRRGVLLPVLVLMAGLAIAALPPAGPAFAGTWAQEATGGFGNPANVSARASAVYNSRLYVGTDNGAGLEILSYDGETWRQEVGGSAAVGAGFGNAANFNAASMIVHDSLLWVGTSNNVTGCEVWRFDGTNWTQVVGALSTALVGPGFGNPGNLEAYSMAVYGNELYVGTFCWGGCEVWRFDGTSWTQEVGGVATPGPGFGTGCIVAESMAVYGTELFVGTGSPAGGEIWSFNGAVWTQRVGALPGTPTGIGFGNLANTDVSDMAVYGTSLFAGTNNDTTGIEIWAWDGASWTPLVAGLPAAIIGSGFGNPANITCMQLKVYDSRLFAGTYNLSGCEVWSYDGFTWTQEVGGGAAGTFKAPGFGDANNDGVDGAEIFNNRLYLNTSNYVTGCDVFSLSASTTWYLAEGATAGGFETWVLVQNPNPTPVNVALTFQTETGAVPGPTDTVPANSRRSYLVNNYVSTFNVSTAVQADNDIFCERSMYWTPEGTTVRRVGHDSIGVVNPASTWYMAEGATAGGFETWVLVQNPNPTPVNIDMRFQTGSGEVQGPQETLPGNTRRSYPVDLYVDTFDVSTRVDSYMGDVVCERAVYFTPDGYATREVGHDSIGVTSPSFAWYMAEGATGGDFETWVLVQNPNPMPVNIDMRFQTGAAEIAGPVDTVPARSRRSYLVNNWTSTYDVSTKVTSTGGAIICERAMYENSVQPEAAQVEAAMPAGSVHLLGHDSIGATAGRLEWYLPEGATAGGFETYVLVQNPNPMPVNIDMRFQTGAAEIAGPVDTVPARSRRSYLVNNWTSTYDVSTKVTSTGGAIICERAVYWRPNPGSFRYLGTCSIGYCP
ncbi:MAG: hypothetical protein HPY75_14050 [Actinobacteria bacterium]|nr:hypothetical protein [Actinomycetota bacterium]